MTVLALIPARGGSKRLPRKNLQTVGTDSLVNRAVRSAFAAGIFDHVVLTTDSDEIANHAKGEFNHLKIFKRPSELAEDDTPMLEVLRHAVVQFKHPPDDIVLLQPTSPFRTVDDIREAYTLYQDKEADAVVSVTEPEADLVFRVGHAGRMRADPGVVVPNGAVYILRRDALMCGHDWYSGCSYAYKMPKERSMDIDTPMDLAMARAALEHTNAA